ncbi:hypothetical protein ACIBCU_29345 [Streptomyces sp. NPDC051064]|uniref:hypothetical protein n=1 Tax=Streptomyces sp. NPDC051064 TaxID=3365641 RepID=UPI0037AA05A6
MSRGYADRCADFAARSAGPAREAEGLRPAQRAEDVEPLFLGLADQLDRAPRDSGTPGDPLTGNGLRQAFQYALYSDAAFPAVARLVQEARRAEADRPCRRTWPRSSRTRTRRSWSR